MPQHCQGALGLAAAGRKGGGVRGGSVATPEGRAVAAVGVLRRFLGHNVHTTTGLESSSGRATALSGWRF